MASGAQLALHFTEIHPEESNDADVPDEWDAYIGMDRLGRAHAFTQALESLGANVTLTVFPNADHTLTDDMRLAGCDALAAGTG